MPGPAALALAALLATAPGAAKQPPTHAVRHPLRVEQPRHAPREALLAVEIPAGGTVKYEIGSDGLLFVDRFLSMPVAYPANYGSLPRTLAGDGDPLDALVLTRTQVHPGVLIHFRPVGVLRMTDRGEADEKIIGVPTEAVDPTYATIRDLRDLPPAELERIEAFFRVYKMVPEPTNPVVLHGYGNAAQARSLIETAMQRFQRRESAHPAGATSDADAGKPGDGELGPAAVPSHEQR